MAPGMMYVRGAPSASAPRAKRTPLGAALRCGRASPATGRQVSLRASTTASPATEAIELLKEAGRTRKVSEEKVLEALLSVTRAKSKPEATQGGASNSWRDTLGAAGSTPAEGMADGATWKLIYTVPAKKWTQALKAGPAGNVGAYWKDALAPAAQRWSARDMEIENGVFPANGAIAFTLRGPFVMSGQRLCFDFTSCCVKLGSLELKFDIAKPEEAKQRFKDFKEWGGKGKTDKLTPNKVPFFVFKHVDDGLAVAQGRSGGVAFWVRVPPEEVQRRGIRSLPTGAKAAGST
ncbi:unnamed protein product [Pedinophyceae sp. YPF-701]|nr:unnamed protein product [Pedinophyceae sp. YPF-701]